MFEASKTGLIKKEIIFVLGIKIAIVVDIIYISEKTKFFYRKNIQKEYQIPSKKESTIIIRCLEKLKTYLSLMA